MSRKILSKLPIIRRKSAKMQNLQTRAEIFQNQQIRGEIRKSGNTGYKTFILIQKKVPFFLTYAQFTRAWYLSLVLLTLTKLALSDKMTSTHSHVGVLAKSSAARNPVNSIVTKHLLGCLQEMSRNSCVGRLTCRLANGSASYSLALATFTNTSH